MSFVYAVNDIEFLIMSDTKISFSDRLSCWNSDFERKLVEQLGLIKSIIVSPNMVVCYAGNNIDGAAKLLREIKLVGYNLEKTIERAFQIHKEDKVDAIEFIIGYSSKNKKELVSVKNGQIIRGCKIAWLGSWDAYNQFKSMESTMVLDEQIQLKSELIQWE